MKRQLTQETSASLRGALSARHAITGAKWPMRLAAKVGRAIAFCGLPVRGGKGRRQKPTACRTGRKLQQLFRDDALAGK
jgi:hypothetical protein